MSALDRVDKQYIVMLQGKPHPTYPGVLAAAMEAGLLELTVKVVQAPTPENGQMAICEAMASFPGPEGRERIFAEVGDASPGNVNKMIAPHVLRMAATRAKGRALRDALGIGVALAEEMSDPQPEQPEPLRTVSAPKQAFCRADGCENELTQVEIHASAQAGWPPTCSACGKARRRAEREASVAR